jgi:2-octaprenylphenol hydroxylase
VTNQYDIVIVGGGMVGLAMAASLAESELNILLIEKQPLDDSLPLSQLSQSQFDQNQSDVRVSAISPANRRWLETINAWQNIPDCLQANYQSMKVWDGDGTGSIEFSAADIAEPDLGVIVENQIVQAAILKSVKSYGNIRCIFGHAVEQIEVNQQKVELHLDDGRVCSGQLLIGADGAHSVVKQALDIQSSETDYQQLAYVANVRCELPHQDTAWQRFTPFGPVAFLPMPSPSVCSVVWSLDKQQTKQLQGLSRQEFAQKLQYAFESRLGKVELISDYFSFPLVKRHASHYLTQRVALVGDAAHTIHPLAGQGVNLGFQDASCLSALILKLKQEDRDFGLKANLRPFERERKTENLIMQNAMSGFKHLFANQTLPVTLLRNFAMSALDNVPMVKQTIIRKAMGF